MKNLLLLLIIPFLSFGQTPCLDAVANATGLIGEFIPQCEDDGSYSPIQCWGSTGYCWCVDENGVEIPGTAIQTWLGEPDCSFIETCNPLYDCGPLLGIPNYLCNDSITVAGPGDCVMNEAGECAWEIIYCPEEIGCSDPDACNYNPETILGNFGDDDCLYNGDSCILVVDSYCSCCGGPCDGICPSELLDSLYGENWFCFYDVSDLSYEEGEILISGFINEKCECIANELGNYCSQLSVTDIVIDSSNMTIDIAIYDGNIGGAPYPYIAYTIDNLGDTIQTGNINSFGNLGLDTSWYEYSLNSLPTYPLTVCYVYGMDADTCVLTYSSTLSLIEETTLNKKLITTIDILGRETNNKSFQLHIYDDGSVEKKYLIK